MVNRKLHEERVGALVDAMSHLKGSLSTPESDLYKIKNPIGVKSFSMPGKNEIDGEGRRVFSSWLAGRRACEFDVALKVSGTSRCGIKPDDELQNVLRVFDITHPVGQQQVVKYLRRALRDDNIAVTTKLAYFRGEESDNVQ